MSKATRTPTDDARTEMKQISFPFVEWAYALFRRTISDGDRNRSIHIIRYAGAYRPAGYVFTIEGSPPRGTFMIAPDIVIAHRDGVVKKGLPGTRLYDSTTAWIEKFGLDSLR